VSRLVQGCIFFIVMPLIFLSGCTSSAISVNASNRSAPPSQVNCLILPTATVKTQETLIISENIQKQRSQINLIDAEIIRNIAKRNELSKKIGDLKSSLNKEIIDSKREQQLIKYHEVLSHKYQVDSDLIKQIFNLIILHSRQLQK
jgi:chorismate mutase